LGEKREFKEYTRSNRRIRERISARYGRYGKICQRAKLCAGIKPTAFCSVFNKENSIEFSLDSVHYLYMKSNPNPSFYPVLPYESLSSYASIDKKINEMKMKRKIIIRN